MHLYSFVMYTFSYVLSTYIFACLYECYVDIKGLSSVLSAVIDFRGNRIIAQSVIPGILSGVRIMTFITL